MAASPAPSSGTPKPLAAFMRSLVPRFMRKKTTNFSRQHERKDCVLLGTMIVEEVGAQFDGVVLDMSLGGCSFRPATLYLLDRPDVHVTVQTEYFKMHGIIRATRPHSYGIQFSGMLEADVVTEIMSKHGGSIHDSFLARPQ